MVKQKQIKGLKKLNKKLNNIVYTVEGIPTKELPQIASEGTQYAKQIAPIATGALVSAITFKQYGESWLIISGQPKKDFYNYPYSWEKVKTPLPYHVWIETGKQKAKTGQNAYMKQTADYLSQVFFARVKDKIKNAVKS